MIKVGDVYKDLNEIPMLNHTITYIGRDTIYFLTNDGAMFMIVNRPYDKAEFLRNRERITEFDTWQEAINSPEFKREK